MQKKIQRKSDLDSYSHMRAFNNIPTPFEGGIKNTTFLLLVNGHSNIHKALSPIFPQQDAPKA